jgi:multisubunit Na+/H+ antiporter MnhB subunit
LCFCEGFLEIRNQRKFLVGLIILILGSFVIVFDYPQIQYLYYLEKDTSQTLEKDEKEIYQKILIEFSIGIVLFGLGIFLILISILKRFENRIR